MTRCTATRALVTALNRERGHRGELLPAACRAVVRLVHTGVLPADFDQRVAASRVDISGTVSIAYLGLRVMQPCGDCELCT